MFIARTVIAIGLAVVACKPTDKVAGDDGASKESPTPPSSGSASVAVAVVKASAHATSGKIAMEKLDGFRTYATARARACYTAGLREDPTQKGRLVYTVNIAASGAVESAEATTNNGMSTTVAACIASGIRILQIDVGGAAASLAITFDLTPEG